MEVDLAPHPVVGPVFQVGDVEKFPKALGFESLDRFFPVSKQGRCFTAIAQDGGGICVSVIGVHTAKSHHA